MLILGLQGSPRKGGNTDTLLTAFLDKASQAGAAVKTIQVARAGIEPCKGCGYCEKHGVCVIADDPMSKEIFGLLRAADVVVAASPVFFYGITAQLKGLIDRSQTLWSRKYVYRLNDPLAGIRKGVLLSVAASHGRQLFDGIHLTAKYFFDAIDAQFAESLTYRGVETKGAIRDKKGVDKDIDALVENMLSSLIQRKKVVFVSQKGACLAPMAAALAQQRHGDAIRTDFAGRSPAAEFSPAMVATMERLSVDMAYRKPQHPDDVFFGATPDLAVAIGIDTDGDLMPGVKTIRWDATGPSPADEKAADHLRQRIQARVDTLMREFE
jgi:arsenate reductase